ncbi:AraC family transcriptional regulator [Corynebacterium halotolerans]|uniref:AraC family transcriptional regulator n=1 Tax=Corynebacterium halotolerans YIM 70093 = DSM 44683 TaxID=1121362 RepID=M1P9X1_9CORY|nr:AraC family transcriptional regulator [Corynebacterium halotolerans]AGF73456.1 AraC family transcriptional regulator [Corynebacterium halotolerans YIM 70093 = DSM 44683]
MPKEQPKRSAQILRFTTRGLSPESRVQLWEGHNARALIPLDIRTIDDSPMRSQQTNLHLPSVRMASVIGTSQIVERSESFISENPTGMMAVFFAVEGEAFFFHRGGHLNLHPGQAVVYDADRPFVRGFSRGLREIVLTIPKDLYAELVGPSGPDLPAVFDFGAGAGASEQALANLLQATLSMVAPPAPVAEPEREAEPGQRQAADGRGDLRPNLARAEEDTFGLLRLVLGAPDSSAAGLVASAKNFIERHLADQNLSPARVAAAVGISERQLGRHFADAGTTVGRYIQGRRLELARDLLASPDHGRLTVAEVAVRSGFPSQSHFGRVFRRRFGITPLQWRKEARRGLLYG